MNDATVVILAGGKGTRLAPYTTVLPKPLVPVGTMPILEIVLWQLQHYGFRDIVISVGHLAELIMAFFGDGSKWGLKIRYVIEDQPLGTIGPLHLIEGLDKPFVVMNGDLLTDINYAKLYEYHRGGDQVGTVATAQREVGISLGVLEYDVEHQVTAFREKPRLSYSVSMGIYIFSPAILKLIPPRRYYGFDTLMLDMLSGGHTVRVYPFEGLWLDIGRREDFENAVEVFEANRSRFLPQEPGGGRG